MQNRRSNCDSAGKPCDLNSLLRSVRFLFLDWPLTTPVTRVTEIIIKESRTLLITTFFPTPKLLWSSLLAKAQYAQVNPDWPWTKFLARR